MHTMPAPPQGHREPAAVWLYSGLSHQWASEPLGQRVCWHPHTSVSMLCLASRTAGPAEWALDSLQPPEETDAVFSLRDTTPGLEDPRFLSLV